MATSGLYPRMSIVGARVCTALRSYKTHIKQTTNTQAWVTREKRFPGMFCGGVLLPFGVFLGSVFGHFLGSFFGHLFYLCNGAQRPRRGRHRACGHRWHRVEGVCGAVAVLVAAAPAATIGGGVLCLRKWGFGGPGFTTMAPFSGRANAHLRWGQGRAEPGRRLGPRGLRLVVWVILGGNDHSPACIKKNVLKSLWANK